MSIPVAHTLLSTAIPRAAAVCITELLELVTTCSTSICQRNAGVSNPHNFDLIRAPGAANAIFDEPASHWIIPISVTYTDAVSAVLLVSCTLSRLVRPILFLIAMSSSRTARAVTAFFAESEAPNRQLNALGLVPAEYYAPVHQSEDVEKRVVRSWNSDCQPYSYKEFETFFGEDALEYWEDAVVLPRSTARKCLYLFGDASAKSASSGSPRPSPRKCLWESLLDRSVALSQMGLPRCAMAKVLAFL